MGLFTKDIKTMNDLFVHQLQDIYYAEQQLTKALPKMAGKATRFGLHKCYACRKQFRVTVGTIFEKSHVPLHVWLQAYLLQEFSGLCFRISLRRHAMDDEWARDDLANRAARIQRRVWVLEDDLHPPPHRLHFAAAGARDLLPVKHDVA